MILSLCLFYLNFYLLLEPTFNLKKYLLFLPVYSKKTQKNDVAECDTLLFLDVMLMQDQNSAVAWALPALALCSVRLLSGCLCSLQGLCEALVFQRNSSGGLDSEHVCREKLLRECPWLQLHHRQLAGGLWPPLLSQPGTLPSWAGLQPAVLMDCWGELWERQSSTGFCLWSHLKCRCSHRVWEKSLSCERIR